MKKLSTILALLFLSAGVCFAQQGAVVDDELQALLETAPESLIDINIVMKSQPDKAKIQAARSTARDRATCRKRVVDFLKDHSTVSQESVLALLKDAEAKGLVAKISSRWVANSINCHAAKEVVLMLASHPDVLAIGCNKEVELVKSIEHETPALVSVSSHSATPHVLQVGADVVWSQGYTGKNVVVAVLDSGTNPDHYDLKDHLWTGYADTDGDGDEDDVINGWNFVANNSNITDDFGHGTHCAGIVCGDGTVGNVTGVAPDATLMTVKVVNRNGGGTPAQMIGGVQFAVENGADILSISLGFKKSQISESDIVALRRTFENTLLLGVVVCAAAGNDGDKFGAPDNVDFPAACPPPYLHADQQVNAGGLTSVICVGSVDGYDKYVTTSSIGPVTWQDTDFEDYLYDNAHIGLIRPDICAPGVLVYSLKHDEVNKYKYLSGTSQATPCVAGVIALMLEKNPALTPAQVCEAIENTAKKLTDAKSNYTGSGRIDAVAAVKSVAEATGMPFFELVEYTPFKAAKGESINVDFTLLNSGKGDAAGVNVKLTTDDPYVTIKNSETVLGNVKAGKKADLSFVIVPDAAIPNGHTVYMTMAVAAGEFTRMYDVAVMVTEEARVVCRSFTPESVKPGNNIKIKVDLVNDGTVPVAGKTDVVMTAKSPHVVIVNGKASFDAMGVNEVKSAEFVVNVLDTAPDNSSVSFDLYATPGNFATPKDILYEFEPGLDENGRVVDGFDGWTTFDASDDGRNHPWWHSSVWGVHWVENVGAASSGKGQMMSEASCQSSMIEYEKPIDNYLVSPKVRATTGSKFSFKARIHGMAWYGEHFGVAVSENGNSSAADFKMINEWTIAKEDGDGWIAYEVDLSAYAGKDVYVAIRHFFTEEMWKELLNGYYVYILHVDDAAFTDVIDLSTKFVYDNYSYFSLNIEGNPLPAPANVVATAVSEREIKLSWNAVLNAQEYKVYRDGLYLASTAELDYIDSGLSADTEYSYAVSAVYNGKEYERSAVVSATTDKADYSVKIHAITPGVLSVGKNVMYITMVNNGIYEQKSRSALYLSSEDPYVEVATGSVGMKYLAAGEMIEKTFVVEIGENAPNGHLVKFNLNIAELYEDKNSWDCPFVLEIVNPDVPTVINGVKEQRTESNDVYDLYGRKVKNPSKGIYIIDGKKVYIRE